MKTKNLLIPIVLSGFTANVYALDVELADTAWNGNEVPSGQQCQKFGGVNPTTPKLSISDIPPTADTIILEYSDRDSERMNNGGHGRMSFKIDAGLSKVDVPSVAGHTFDLPSLFSIIEAHRSPGWDKAGAYMPPCSGGKGHEYYVTVKAAQGENIMASTVIELGKF